MTFRPNKPLSQWLTLMALTAMTDAAVAAESPWSRKQAAAEDLLPASQAFQLVSAERSGDEVTVTWSIAPGYYLYRKRLGFEAAVPSGLSFDAPRLPQGEAVADERDGTNEVYRETLKAQLHARSDAAALQQLRVRYQGCADVGVCYPPVTALIGVTPASR